MVKDFQGNYIFSKNVNQIYFHPKRNYWRRIDWVAVILRNIVPDLSKSGPPTWIGSCDLLLVSQMRTEPSRDPDMIKVDSSLKETQFTQAATQI